MSRRQRKTDRKNISPSVIVEARKLIEDGYSKRKAAELLGVRESSLRKRLKTESAPQSLGRYKCTFTTEMEIEFLKYVQNLDPMFFGITGKNLRRLAYDFADKNKIEHKFNNELKIAGKDWLRGFMKRHPSLSLRQPTSTSAARAMGFNKPQVSPPCMFIGPLIHSISLKNLEFIEDGILIVSNGKIEFLQQNSNNADDIQKRYGVKDENVFRLVKGQFLIPGFVDTHIHGPQYPNIGLGYDLPLLEWLSTYTFPLEAKFCDESFAKKVYTAVVKKTLANGTTTACYYATIHRTSSIIFAETAKKLGQRAFIGKVNMNKNTPKDYGETFEESLTETKAFIESVLALNDPLIKPIITPRFALSCDMPLMKALAQMAADFNIPIQTHVSENMEEIKQVKREYLDYKNYVDVYDKAGLVNNKTILAHGIYLNSHELGVIKEKGASISHCASSNTLLQSGACPVRRYLDAGIKLSLGTDCSGGNSCSILDAIRQSLELSIHLSFTNPDHRLSVEELFYLATLGGAEAMDLLNETGNFTVGKYFDSILVDLNDASVLDLLENYNLKQLFQKFIYLGDDRVMKKVFVAGKVVKQL